MFEPLKPLGNYLRTVGIYVSIPVIVSSVVACDPSHLNEDQRLTAILDAYN
jgi:hypothetical protein